MGLPLGGWATRVAHRVQLHGGGAHGAGNRHPRRRTVRDTRFACVVTTYIHRDLIFPHHENELAQSAAAAGPCCGGAPRDFVRYWVHNGFVNVDRCAGCAADTVTYAAQ